QYSSESLRELDIDWEEQLLDNIDWEDNVTEYLHDYITLYNLEDYKKYLQDNDNDLMNSDNNTEQNTQESNYLRANHNLLKDLMKNI
ncbi:13174_t:CDS:2, partial [Racocetra fulgida]